MDLMGILNKQADTMNRLELSLAGIESSNARLKPSNTELKSSNAELAALERRGLAGPRRRPVNRQGATCAGLFVVSPHVRGLGDAAACSMLVQWLYSPG
jgi:hypothetical protein